VSPNSLKDIIHQYKDIIRAGLMIRMVENRILRTYSEGKIHGTVHTCIGQEIVGPSIKRALQKDDFIVSNHRGHGHYLAMTGNIAGLIAEVMGKEAGICRGVGGSQHLFDNNFISNGIQGGMAPIAAGIALANQYRNTNNIVVAFIGDGTLGEGVLYEAFNISSLWKLPILFVLENNQYAQSTSIEQTFSGNLKKRIEGFGLRYLKTDTWDLESLTNSVAEAVKVVRFENIPTLLEIETYRLHAHSKGDDNRSEIEIAKYVSKDILTQLILSESTEIKSMLTQIEFTIEEAVRVATDSPCTAIAKADDVISTEVVYEVCTYLAKEQRINELIYESLREKFTADANYVLLGEDIEYKTPWTPNPYGGAFKVSKDLSELFKGRIRNTPISEAAIVGIGTGLALAGMKPVVEIMFGDFMTLAFDQIVNHATKFCQMYGKRVNVPLIIRTPMGGRRGYGPTHSQSLEKHFYGVPNLSIVALNARIHPAELYRSIYANTNPTLLIENKVLYTRQLNTNIMPGFIVEKTVGNFPTLRIRLHDPCPPDVTIVCYGGMLEEVERAVVLAFDEDEIACEIICPTLLNPLNHAPIIESVRKSRKLLVVEEGSTIASLGSEIASKLLAKSVQLVIFRHIGNNSIIPCSVECENYLLPNHETVLAELKDMAYD